MRNVASHLVASLALVAVAGACRKQPPSAEVSPPRPVASEPGAGPQPVAENAPTWTAERVRQFVVDTEEMVAGLRNKALSKHLGDQAAGECYGEAAYPMGKADEIVPILEGRLTGRALKCYLATYFGCRLGDAIASAGISLDGPISVPFEEARTSIVEQSPDRVVAEVGEAEFNMVLKGKLNPREADGKSEHLHKSRYTLIRDAKGTWRISDRTPSFKWECREK